MIPYPQKGKYCQIVNLFVNASQATNTEKDPRIFIRLWIEDGRVFFSIEDNGCGIPEEILPEIFEERFTTKPEGTGLGLHIVKQIVDAHQGTIDVSSVTKKGTRFTLSFPACQNYSMNTH